MPGAVNAMMNWYTLNVGPMFKTWDEIHDWVPPGHPDDSFGIYGLPSYFDDLIRGLFFDLNVGQVSVF